MEVKVEWRGVIVEWRESDLHSTIHTQQHSLNQPVCFIFLSAIVAGVHITVNFVYVYFFLLLFVDCQCIGVERCFTQGGGGQTWLLNVEWANAPWFLRLCNVNCLSLACSSGFD